MSGKKRSVFWNYFLVALPGMVGIFVAAIGFYANEPLLFAMGLALILAMLVLIPCLWITNRRASHVHTDGDTQVFRYPALLTVGAPAATWFSAFFWTVLFLVPDEGLMIWVWRFVGIALIAMFSVGAYRVTRTCRNNLGEIRLSALGIESRLHDGHPCFIPWSEVVELSAAPYSGVAGHGVQVVGAHATLPIYEKIRGIRVLKNRLMRLAKEHDIPDAAVCWDRFGLITDADRIGR